MVKYPEDWKVVPLGDVAAITRGGSPRPIQAWLTDSSDGLNWIKIGDVSVGAKYITSTEERIIPLGARYSREVKSGDFILSNSMSFGRPYILKIDGCIHDGWLAIQEYSKSYDTEYLYYILSSEDVFSQYVAMAAGSSVKNLNKDKVSDVKIPLPPLPEQKRIAAVLGNVDKLIDNLSRQIEKKRLVKQGVMQDLLTGKKRLPGFKGEWRQVIMGKIGSFYGGLSGKSSSDFNGGNAKYITFMNVLTNVVIDREQLGVVSVKPGESQNLVQKDDLFFNGSSETPEEVAMCAALLEDMSDTYLNSFCCGFRLSGAEHDPLFISYYFNSPQGRESVKNCAQGLTRYNLSKQTFLQTVVNWPTLAEQKAIAKVLGDMDAEIVKLEAKHEKYRQLKQGLMNDLLTGKVRI